MNRISRAAQRVLWLVYPLTFLVPRKKEIWLLGAYRDQFADNAKYLFLYLVRNHPEIRAYWVTGSGETYQTLKKLKLPVLRRWSVKGIYFALRAGVYFFCNYVSDINFWFSGGAIHVNLWHGIGIKQIEAGITSGPLKRKMNPSPFNPSRLLEPDRWQRPDYFLSSTPVMTEHFARSFRIPQDRCLEYGYPRSDIFFDEEFREYSLTLVDYSQLWGLLKHHRKAFLLAPTFRDSGIPYLKAANINLRALDRTLAARDLMLIIKFHIDELQDEMWKSFEGLTNIALCPSDLDLYPILPEFHALITDYSSLYYDFILLGRPVIIYAFDVEEFNRDSRAFAMSFNENVFSTVATDDQELSKLLVGELSVNPRTEELVKKFWGSYRGKSCERIYNKIMQVTTHERSDSFSG